MSDTPRTENARIRNGDLSDWGAGLSNYVSVEFARTLERELNAALAELEQCRQIAALERKHLAPQTPTP